MSKKYTFREITEKDELEKFFRLRYNIYSKCRMNAFIKSNDHKIDIDPYDAHSSHFALICNNKDAGYLRVVYQKDKFIQKPVLELAKKHMVFRKNQNEEPDNLPPLPFLNCNAVPESYHRFYDSIAARNEEIVEASRLILHPDYRTIRSSMFLIECAMVLYLLICQGRKHAIVSCFQDHALFYKRFGFQEIDKSGGFKYPGVSCAGLFLALILSGKPCRNHSKFQEMAGEFKKTNKITTNL